MGFPASAEDAILSLLEAQDGLTEEEIIRWLEEIGAPYSVDDVIADLRRLGNLGAICLKSAKYHKERRAA